MPNDFEDHDEETVQTVTTSENKNPLAPPEVGEAIYSQLESGKWVGILNVHANHQFQALGVTKDECVEKIKIYLEGE